MIVADTLLFPCCSMLRKLGNICCGHEMFLTKIRNIFCVPDTKFVSATNVARAGKRGNICVRNNVSATMCPRLPVPLHAKIISYYPLFTFCITNKLPTIFYMRRLDSSSKVDSVDCKAPRPMAARLKNLYNWPETRELKLHRALFNRQTLIACSSNLLFVW